MSELGSRIMICVNVSSRHSREGKKPDATCDVGIFFLNDSLSGDVTNKGREFPTFKRSGGTTVTLPPCPPVTLSHCHTVSLPHCLPSLCLPVSLSPCHTATLSPICLSQCLPVSRLSSPGSSLPSRLPSIPSSVS